MKTSGPCIHELFEQQVERHPDAVAVVHDGESLTYRELDDRANRLAHHLRSLGVGPDVLVGLCLEREPDLIAALLGILKAGGAYVPLDPGYPPDRLAIMLDDVAVPVLVTQRSLLARLPPTTAEMVCLDEPLPGSEVAAADVRPSPVVGPDNLAYVIFTSGSTGRPKGVLVTHRNVVRLMQATQPWFCIDERDVWTMFHSVAFDFSVWEIYGALLHGGRLVIVPYLVSRSPEAFYDLLCAEQVTVLNQTPTAFHQLMRVDASESRTRQLSLRLVIFGGEKLQMASLADWFARHGDAHPRLVNMYGITETTVHVTYRPLTTADVQAPSMIGMPIPDLQVHLLDEDLQPVPDNVPGEIFVGGAGVARGYLNRPELTAERFIPDPFRDDPHARLYRTGDRGRRLPGGDIEYLGRADDQLKIRGFRIEPGEIEAALLKVEGIRQAAVVARDAHPGDTRLLACLVGQSGTAADASIRAALSQTLPDHMLPARCVWLESLPLTANGKLDRQSLPAWPTDAAMHGARETSVAPRTPVEEQLAAMWCDLLVLDGVGVHDNFFELGGDSLTAMQLVATVRQVFGVHLPVAFFFARPTLAELAETITTTVVRAPADVPQPAVAVGPRVAIPRPAATDGAFESPVTAAQQSMLLLQSMSRDPATYNQPIAFRATSAFDAGRLRRALASLMARHAMLRTGLVSKDEHLMQRVMPVGGVAVSWREMWPDWPDGDRDRQLTELLVDDARRPFDLSQPPLWRVLLVHVGSSDAVLQFTFHHSIVDDWSLRLMMVDLEDFYTTGDDRGSVRSEDQFALKPISLSGDRVDYVRSFWQETLRDPPDGPRWLTDTPRSAVATGRGSWHRFTIESEPVRRLRELAAQENTTLFTVMLAACHAWLHRISGEDDLVVGTPVADRSRPESQRAVGYFLNTLPIRLRWNAATPLEDGGFRGVARKVHDAFHLAMEHGDLPFEQIVGAAARGRSVDGQPLFRVLFVFLGSPLGICRLGDAAMQPMPVDTGTSKFDLTLFVESVPEGFACSIEYSTDVFDAAEVSSLAEQFAALVRAVAADPYTPLDTVSLLTPADLRIVTVEQNRLVGPPAPTECIHTQFDAQADRTPDAVALAWDGGAWTYRELKSRADRLAVRLRELGVGPDVPVGLFVERSPDLFVGILGILKAGGGYVPMDASLPASRLAFMLTDSACPVVVAARASLQGLRHAIAEARAAAASPDEAGDPVVLLLDDDAAVPQLTDTVLPRGAAAVDQLAYVLYTSGSTGQPKGVAMPHGPLVNLLAWQGATSCMGPGNRTLQFASPGFDVSFQEFFSTWLSGGTLVLVAEQVRRDPSALLSAIDRDGIERLFLPVVMLDHLAEAAESLQLFPESLREVIVAGEQLRITPAIRQFFARLPACRLWNHYGPTETHVATGYLLPADPSSWPDLPPIGRSIANTQVYLLDRHMQPVPRGVAGDLWIGGAAVARGYWHRPELTAERFVADPFREDSHARLYRTGDRGRWRMDGNLEFLGRTDNQVKIRGHRVELGEIEAVLGRHPGVRAAAAVVRGNAATARSIVAFIVGHEEAALRPVEVRSWLRARLPEPCVPSRVVMLPALPLNANGKVDSKALEGLAAAQGRGDDAAGECVVFERPDGERETLLASLWQSLLNVDQIGRHDDFFALGGTSLLAMRLATRVRDAFGVEAAVRDVFEQPTLAGLAARWTPRGVAEQPSDTVAAVVCRPRRGTVTAVGPRVVAVSAAQRRLWFLQQYAPESPVYTIAAAHVVRGPLDIASLGSAVNWIVARHESLRSTFTVVEGEVVATVAETATWPLVSVDATGATAAEREADALARLVEECRRPFDLEHGPLVRGCVVRLSPEEHVVALFMHHAVFDGWSMGVFHREVAEGYEALRDGREPAIDDMPIQYADFAAWQNEWVRGVEVGEHEDYWRRQLAGAPAHLDLPTDKVRPAVESFRGAVACRLLEPAVIDALVMLTQQEACTPFMVLLTTFAAVLGRWSDAEDIVVGTPLADRSRQEAAELIGCLVNTLAIRIDLSGRPSFRQLLARVRATVLDAFAHGELPFERVVDLLRTRRDAARTPVFQVMFAWQDDTAAPLQLPGLATEPLPFDGGVSHFDMTLFAVRTAHGIELRLEYATDLFEAATADRMLDGVATLLAAATADPDTLIGRLPIATPHEQDAMLALAAGSAGADAGEVLLDATLVDRFAEQVARTPAAIAVSCNGRSLTYGELDAEASRLAHHLRASGAEPGSFVGILLDRSVEFVVAVLGILKAGCAYAPLPAEYPNERLAFMIADTRMPLLVTERAWINRLPKAGVGMVFMAGDEPWRKASAVVDGAAIASASVTAESPAYVMYTSGSTGRPKGVVVSHRAVVRLVTGQSYVPFGPKLRTLLLAPTAFDASTFELWAPLLHGGTCGVFPDRHPDLDRLGQVIRKERVNCLWLTAGLFNHVIDSGAEILATVDHVLTGGDVLSVPHVRKALSLLPQTRLVNGYGPTESTTFACTYAIGRDDAFPRGSVPIGRPLANTTCFIVNESLEPVPIGIPGELLIGGVGLALGYLHQPELTAEKFIPDPFSGAPGARLYRTGDRCRWQPDGTIEFLGRRDGQVKIRGHRVETEEVEAAVAAMPGVGQAAVVVRSLAEPGGSTQKLLRACVVPRPGAMLDVTELRRDLARRVPEPMMPGEWLVLESLPLTENGKLDRSGLASVPIGEPVCRDAGEADGQPTDAAPRTLLELEIAKVWQQLFGRDHVARTDDFFELGGHSLLAAQLMAELEQRLGHRVPIAAIFKAPTVESLAELLSGEPWVPAWQLLAPLQPEGSRRPLFMIHGLGGDVFWYQPLARLLAPHQPVYGVRAASDGGCQEDNAQDNETVEAMAADYVKEIRALQPEGPYRIGGASLGGWMAYAVAAALRSQGQPVMLLIFDTYPNCRVPRPAVGVKLLMNVLVQISHLGLHFRRMSALPVHQWLRYIAWRIGRRVAPSMAPVWKGGLEAVQDDPLPAAVSADRYVQAVARYSARSIEARLELFLERAPLVPSLMAWSQTRFWRGLVQGPMNVHRQSCEHLEMFSADGLPELAAIVNDVLADEFRPETTVGGRS